MKNLKYFAFALLLPCLTFLLTGCGLVGTSTAIGYPVDKDAINPSGEWLSLGRTSWNIPSGDETGEFIKSFRVTAWTPETGEFTAELKSSLGATKSRKGWIRDFPAEVAKDGTRNGPNSEVAPSGIWTHLVTMDFETPGTPLLWAVVYFSEGPNGTFATVMQPNANVFKELIKSGALPGTDNTLGPLSAEHYDVILGHNKVHNGMPQYLTQPLGGASFLRMK